MKKKMSRRLLVLAVAGSVFMTGFGAAAVIAASGGNQTALHQASGTIPNTQCIACHGQQRLSRSLDPNTPTAHARHLFTAFLLYQNMERGCATCHVSTDVRDGSGAVMGRQVDPASCLRCHGTFTTTSHAGLDQAALNPRGCTAAGCHSNPAAIHAGVEDVNKFFTRGRAFCTKCHGGLDFYAVEETNLP